jgi:hypothetical protein
VTGVACLPVGHYYAVLLELCPVLRKGCSNRYCNHYRYTGGGLLKSAISSPGGILIEDQTHRRRSFLKNRQHYRDVMLWTRVSMNNSTGVQRVSTGHPPTLSSIACLAFSCESQDQPMVKIACAASSLGQGGSVPKPCASGTPDLVDPGSKNQLLVEPISRTFLERLRVEWVVSPREWK